MDDSAAWRELAARFAELAKEDRGQLYACWSSIPFNDHGDRWFVAGLVSQPVLLESFKWAIERAVVLLGKPATDALGAWLNLLKENSPRYEGGGTSETCVDARWVQRAQTGTIRLVCLASAEYCYKLETEAISHERKVSHLLNPAAMGRFPVLPGPSAVPPTAPIETAAAQIERLRQESRWTIEQLAEKVGRGCPLNRRK